MTAYPEGIIPEHALTFVIRVNSDPVYRTGWKSWGEEAKTYLSE